MPPKSTAGSYNAHTSWRISNRTSTSASLKTNDIWSKTIGHNPYAADDEGAVVSAEAQAASSERAKGIMELARLSNAADGASANRGNEFSQNLFWGLKRKRPPVGYEVRVASEEESSGDDEEDEEDEDAPRHVEPDLKKRKKEKKASKKAKKEEKKRSKKAKKEKKKKKKKMAESSLSSDSD